MPCQRASPTSRASGSTTSCSCRACYDSFILAEDGELGEVILKQFLDLNVRHTPGITHVATVDAAIERGSRIGRATT